MADDLPCNDDLYLAGVVPFKVTRAHGFEWYVVKPDAKKPDLPPPPFQIAKGTRQMRDGKLWRDIEKEDRPYTTIHGGDSHELLEPLLHTALREGREELGLDIENIAMLWDAGVHRFASASTQKLKYMQLYPLKLHNDTQFFAPDAEVGKSAECVWLEADNDTLREDHAAILRDIELFLKSLPGVV